MNNYHRRFEWRPTPEPTEKPALKLPAQFVLLPNQKPVPVKKSGSVVVLPDLLTVAQVHALLRDCPDPLATLQLALELFAGVRPEEMAGLRMREFIPHHSLRVVRAAQRHLQLPPFSCWRRVPILPVLDAWLRPFYGGNSRVFTAPKVRQQVAQTLAAANISRPSLRNTFLYCSLEFYQHDLCQWHCLSDFDPERKPRFLQSLPENGAKELFALTPPTVGITDWSHRVETALHTLRRKT